MKLEKAEEKRKREKDERKREKQGRRENQRLAEEKRKTLRLRAKVNERYNDNTSAVE
jgi:hypothetical protein